MTKKITGYIKLHVLAGKATPAPPIGPALGQHGVNIMEFCRVFNKMTAHMDQAIKVRVLITVYEDRSFTVLTKEPPSAGKSAKYTAIARSKSDAPRKLAKFVSANTGRIVKASPAEPHLGTKRIQKVVRSVVHREERTEGLTH